MKKIIIISVFAGLLMYLSGCFLEDTSCEGEALTGSYQTDIEGVISNLETEINSGTYSGFMNLMHPDSDYYGGSFTEDDYNDLERDYNFYSPSSVTGDTCNASIDYTADNDSVNGMSTEFIMRLDGSTWKVLRWYEEGSTIYRNYQPPQ